MDNVVLALTYALIEKDSHTSSHCERVKSYSLIIGTAMNLTKVELEVLERASKLHDIGKLVVEQAHIRKPKSLDPEEWAHMKRHPLAGFNILKPFSDLRWEAEIVKNHHERWNGSGYPTGISGKDLCVLTAIVAVADSYDAMTSQRPYNDRRSHRMAMEDIIRHRGTLYSPIVVEAFIEAFRPAEHGKTEEPLPRQAFLKPQFLHLAP